MRWHTNSATGPRDVVNYDTNREAIQLSVYSLIVRLVDVHYFGICIPQLEPLLLISPHHADDSRVTGEAAVLAVRSTWDKAEMGGADIRVVVFVHYFSPGCFIRKAGCIHASLLAFLFLRDSIAVFFAWHVWQRD